jgi:hypothetical protein
MTRTWIVRIGQANRRAAAFQNPPAVALGWAEVRGLGDLTGADFEHTVALIGAAAATTAVEPDVHARQLFSFRDDMGVGDLVVAPDAQSGDVLVGAIDGDYAYDPTASDYYPHRRRVTWHGRVRGADIPAALEDDTRGNVTLRRGDDTGDQWLALAQSAAPMTSPSRATRTPRVRDAAARSSTPRKRAAPKPPPKKKPEPQPDRRCPGCGYSWPASQFNGGDLCVECRA